MPVNKTLHGSVDWEGTNISEILILHVAGHFSKHSFPGSLRTWTNKYGKMTDVAAMCYEYRS